MILSYSTFAVLVISVLICKCKAAVQRKATAEELERIDDAYNSWTNCSAVTHLRLEKPELRLAIVERGLEEHHKGDKNAIMFDYSHTDIESVIARQDLEVLDLYLRPKYKLNFNFYFSASFFFTFTSYELYDGSSAALDINKYTPLMVAVVTNKLESVKAIIDASLNPKLKVDMSHGRMPLVNARSIARKFYNPDSRKAMLDILKIDKAKHDLSGVNQNLKNELSITVKEAVLANDVRMVESALLLGNFGDKSDIHIIRWAMMNENYLILEMLVMEGYAIPPEKNRPSYSNMIREDVDFMLKQTDKTTLRPLPKRYCGIFTDYNEHCV